MVFRYNIRKLFIKFGYILAKKKVSEPKSSIMFILLKCRGLHINHLKYWKYMLFISNKILLLNTYKYYKVLFYVYKRMKHYPIQYILGEWYFGDIIVKCKPDVLIPRIETDRIIDLIIHKLEFSLKKKETINFLEIGVGTGAIFISLLLKYNKFKCVGIDINKIAIELSIENAEKYQTNNFELFQMDFKDFTNVDKFDFIVSNPPYIANGTQLMEDLKYESDNALYSGSDGLDLIRIIIPRARELIKVGGFLILEISPEQEIPLFDILTKNKYNNFIFEDDLFGRKRFLIININ
jgi:release factor glutamine methyltransferase